MSDGANGSGVPRPVRVALMDDYEVVVAGLQQMLAPYADRIRVVELNSLLPVQSEIDLLLYDGFSRERVRGPVEDVVRDTDAKFVLYTWNLAQEVVDEAMDKGAASCLSKSLDASELVAALEKVAAGSTVVSDDPGPGAPITPEGWPGRQYGLSARESEVIALIAQGLSNQEIAERAYLSINSIKTFIRSAYRKLGIERRTQAVLWATEHGFVPTATRRIMDEGSSPAHGRHRPR
jgi:NarL family two-component system response regulator LiaR